MTTKLARLSSSGSQIEPHRTPETGFLTQKNVTLMGVPVVAGAVVALFSGVMAGVTVAGACYGALRFGTDLYEKFHPRRQALNREIERVGQEEPFQAIPNDIPCLGSYFYGSPDNQGFSRICYLRATASGANVTGAEVVDREGNPLRADVWRMNTAAGRPPVLYISYPPEMSDENQAPRFPLTAKLTYPTRDGVEVSARYLISGMSRGWTLEPFAESHAGSHIDLVDTPRIKPRLQLVG